MVGNFVLLDEAYDDSVLPKSLPTATLNVTKRSKQRSQTKLNPLHKQL